MGKLTGFQEWPRTPAPKRAKAERVSDFKEFVLPLAPEEAKRQAGRCMDCGVPFCHQGCPLGNPIPDFNDAVWRGKWRVAFDQLSSTNNFPEFTGRLCPAPCEAACVLAVNQDPVTIEQMEKEIIERAFAEGWVTARPPTQRTGKSVAVVGSGPAGLAAAAQLNRAGHTVTIFERSDRLGGLLRYGIPDFKMEKWVIDRRVKLLEQEGVQFETSVDVGVTRGWDELAKTHDAVFIATGAGVARELDVPGRALPGVVQAMTYLEHQNRVVGGLATETPALNARGKKVIVLGGGDTGSDCVGTAHRQGAESVVQIELMPLPPKLRASDNPWPQWPLVFRTSSSQEEGGVRAFALRTQKLEGTQKLEALHGVTVELGRDASGRGTLVDVPGTEQSQQVDLLILALGFTGPDTGALRSQLGLALDPRGNVQVDASFQTSRPGIFAGGDASRGASLIVWAISEGREAARAIDAYLGNGRSLLPTRGAHQPFGGR